MRYCKCRVHLKKQKKEQFVSLAFQSAESQKAADKKTVLIVARVCCMAVIVILSAGLSGCGDSGVSNVSSSGVTSSSGGYQNSNSSGSAQSNDELAKESVSPTMQDTLKYDDGSIYEGEIKDGQANGYGTLTYTDGSVYVGEFLNDHYNGYGTLTSSEGIKMEGEWQDGQLKGQGTAAYSDGSSYEGEWKDGKMYGQGVFISDDGTIYEGEFIEDQFENQGRLVTADGKLCYEGGFSSGEFNGQGILTVTSDAFSNYLEEYIGDDWAESIEAFFGLYTGEFCFEGEFKNGLPDGQCTVSCSTFKYEGEVKNGFPNGSGTWTDSDGTETTGSFLNGFQTNTNSAAGVSADTSAETIFGTLADINEACSTSASVETKKGMTEVDTDSDVNPYDVIYNYGEKFDSYVDACDWSLVFDAEYYAETFPMLALQYHNDEGLLLMHFQTVGIHEGRQASKDFNVGAYIYNCDYSIYKVFKKNYASYYIYYMLNYEAEKDVNTVSADNGKTVKQQYDTVLTWYQAEELKRINQYREKAGSDPVEFDSELAAYASYRAYLNAHDGYEAHDWFEANWKNGKGEAGKAILKMAQKVSGMSIAENTETAWNSRSKATQIAATGYRNSKEHYEAMVNPDNLYVGISNYTVSPSYIVEGTTVESNTHSQFDVYLNWAINTVTHPAD